MRIELWNDEGPDGPELWAVVNGHRLARVVHAEGGYHVLRDAVPPELEPAVRELENGPGSDGPLAYGEIRGVDATRGRTARSSSRGTCAADGAACSSSSA